jgi:hypothetical protein
VQEAARQHDGPLRRVHLHLHPDTKPDLGIRSGWYSISPSLSDERPAEISGYLQKSWPVGNLDHPSEQYRFVPGNYVAYDTSKAGSPAGQNTMVVADK